MREIMALADKANQYIDEKKPWTIAKQEGEDAQLHDVCSVAINLFRVLVAYLKPVLPVLTGEAELFLNSPVHGWIDELKPLVSHQLNDFKPLMTRVEADKIKAIVDASKDDLLKA
jgi:methionyl-tRNA synthetase